MPHAMGSGTISFGLVSIPIKLFSATNASASVSFNQIHEKCGSRIKQQIWCPVCERVVERSELVKGYEFAKDQYVQFTAEELKAIEQENSKMIDIEEFVPLDQVDPIYFESSYYLGADKGGEKAYRLLADAMKQSQRVALAKYVMRGKENLVLIRPAKKGLMLHAMYFGDEIRDFDEIDKGEDAKIKAGELQLAEKLIAELAGDKFDASKYHDEYREKVMAMVNQKVEGKEITTTSAPAERAQVIDLMEALKQSLEQRPKAGAKPERKPAAKAARTATATPKRKTASKR